MTRALKFYLSLALMLGAAAMARGAQPEPVLESARQVPVAYDVDVAVVGGGSGAVAAATAAAKAGAKVFLAAPSPYLGEDLCATMHLWLEEGETPDTDLARMLFAKEGIAAAPAVLKSLKFTYTADLKSSSQHADSAARPKLNDGIVGRPEQNSVQYDGDVAITTDLGSAQQVKEARMVMFHRSGDFSAQSVKVDASGDGQAWKEIATVKCTPDVGDTISVAAPVGAETRFVRFAVKRTANAKRLLVGEIALVPESKGEIEPVAAPKLVGPFRPMHIKKALDDALLANKVQFLYSSMATDVLRDAAGNVCGIVMANRAGRQAVRARVVIDATNRAWVARMAGAKFQPYPAGEQEFKYITIGGAVKSGAGIVAARKTGLSYGVRDFAEAASAAKATTATVKKAAVKKAAGKKAAGKKAAAPAAAPTGAQATAGGPADIIEYTLRIPMADGSFASFAKAEQIARDLTWDEGILFNTDEISQTPPDAMQGAKSGSIEDLGAFRPAGLARVYVLGGCADVPRAEAEKLLRPVALIKLGERIGQAAAAEARALPEVKEATVAPLTAEKGRPAGNVMELLNGVRPIQKGLPTLAQPERALPVLGEYEVVVIGGGTGGAPAGIGAARTQGKTLLVEYLHALGGVGTVGMISKYYHGYRQGFTGTVDGESDWDPIRKAEWWRATLRKEGCEMWFGAIGCGALVENGKVRGVIVATPQGRGVVLAGNVIDATGNSDIAAAAGAQTVNTDGTEPAVQGTGLPAIKPGARYVNTDYTIVDDSDMLDMWHLFVYSKEKYAKAFDMGQLIDTRERRRIVGDFTMTLADAVNQRTYPDTIHLAQSNFDTHGMTVDPYLLIEHPERKSVTVNVPLRCLLPKGLDGILVTGLGISAHRDVMPLLRMQPDIQNQGYVAGMIAVRALREGVTMRCVNIATLQDELVKQEIIPESALGAKDSYPLPQEKIAEAVRNVKSGTGMAAIITNPDAALPLLRQAYASAATDEEKLAYARILGVLRDPTGAETLIKEIERQGWDKGWNYTGGGQYGNALSPLDRTIVALARTGDKRALEPILKKTAELDAKSDFSHARAVGLALEMIGAGEPKAAAALVDLLNKPAMQGYVVLTPDVAAKFSGASPGDNSTRQTSIRELTLARALYRCGDKDGLGKKILEQYAQDLRGHMARHAQAVLEEKTGK